MAVTITNNMTTFNVADNTTNWTSDGGATAYAGFQREGQNCLGDQASNGTVHMYHTLSSGSVSLTDHTIFVWMRSGNPTSEATGGFRIVVGDGTNRAAYYVGGYDNYGFFYNGWSCFRLNTANLPANFATLAGSEASISWSAITQIGAGFNYGSKAVGNADNVFVDIIRHVANNQAALTIGGGGSGTEGTFAEIVTNDESTSNAYGIFRQLIAGSKAYEMQFGCDWGSTGAVDTYFSDSDAQIFVNGTGMDSGAMNVDFLGNSGQTNSFILDNCIFVNVGTISNWDISTSNFTEIKITNSQFIDFGTFSNPTTSANKYFHDTIFRGSGVVTASTMEFDDSQFIAAPGDAVLISSTSHDITDTSFADNPTAINIDTAGNYTLSGGTFSNNTYDIENSITDLTIDSYDLSNQDATQALGNGTTTGIGQSITGDGNALGTVVFYLSKTGSPTGNATAKLYAHSGSFGTSSVPTGAALATSETFDVSTLTGTLQLVKFTFDSTYTPTNTTNYVVTLEYTGGDGSNYVNVGTDTSTPGHGGNFTTYTGSWSAVSGTDAIFYLRCGWVVVNATNGANPGALNYINSAGTFGTTSAYSYNANTTSYTDETTDINNATTNDVAIPPIQATTAGDAIYFGDTSTFTGVTVNVGTAGSYTNITINWEFWDGSTWSALSDVVDETTGFTVSGTNTVNFSEPSDWVGTTVNSVHRFWIRARASWTSGQSITTTPLGTQGWLGATQVNNSVSLEINGVVQNTQCYIVSSAGGATLLNSAAATNVSGDEYKATSSLNYSGDTDVIVRAREMGYLPFQTNATITASGLTITAIWQVDPNWKLVVTGVNINFNENSPSDDTIVRASGDFASDGWIATMSQVTIEGSASNDGTYEIQSIATDTITLATTEDLVQENSASGVTLTFTRREPTW